MRIGIFFEASGKVRDAFLQRGFDAVSVDLRPTESPGPHIQADVFDHLDDGWDAAIMHPTCTFLTVSGLHWNKRRPERAAKTEAALEDVRRLMAAPIPRWAIENPVGCISTRIKRPDQTIQPYEFGEDASKRTCLWLKGLPRLRSTGRFAGRLVEWPRGSGRLVERWSNQTDSGQNALTPSEDRWALRSATYAGIADAFADQWGDALRGALI